MISLVDYGAGNLQSVANMLEKIKAPHRIVETGDQLVGAERILFPGVGHFGQMCDELDSRGLREVLLTSINSGVAYLGICLGMQLLFQGSEESPGAQGLGVFPGLVKKFVGMMRIPHMGWNSLEGVGSSRLVNADFDGAFGYFAHSYFCPVISNTVVSSSHTTEFSAVVEKENVFGVQFHPEKSGEVGERLMRSFAELKC